MGKTSRILLYILVNIIVSAGTMLMVLWLWERAHPQPDIAQVQLPPAVNNLANPGTPLVDQAPSGEPSLAFSNEELAITIRTIVGAGDLPVEYVEIINQGEYPTDLTDWQLLDEDGHQFTFPALILNSNGAVKVLSRAGTDTVIELFWQADAPIWQPGETARLVNTAGKLIASYSIP